MTATANVTVQYVNPPKTQSGPGSIKDSQGRYWTVWPDKLAEFEGMEGQSFLVTYQSKMYKGKRQDTIISAVQASTNDPPFPTTPVRRDLSVSAGANKALVGSDKDECIFVQALIKPWMDKIPVGDAQAVDHAIKMLRAVYKAHWGPKPQAPARQPIARPSLKDELNDEIPFNDDPNMVPDDGYPE